MRGQHIAAIVRIGVAASWLVCGCGGGVSHLPDAPGDDAPDACVPSGTPVVHAGPITADEMWASGIHEVPATIAVTGGTLTIAPCSAVRLGRNASIELSPAASALVARGTAAAPIRFMRASASDPWGHVSAFAPARLDLAQVTLTGGGSVGASPQTTDQLGATLVARGDAKLPHVLAVDHVNVSGSSGLGVFLDSARFTTDSTDLAITNAGFFPILLGADSASELPVGSYTGNATDEILLQTAGGAAAFDQFRTLLADVTVHDRGVPYRVGTVPASIVVGDGLPASPPETLTIEPGVTLKFTPQGAGATSRLQIRGTSTGGPQGALVAAGTAARPVVFTSASSAPVAGDWQGLEFRFAVAPATQVTHATIAFAGGKSFAVGVCESSAGTGDRKEDSAVLVSLVTGSIPPAFLTSSTIDSSANAAVYRGWSVTDVDFLATNTFTNIAGCRQTNIPNAQNQCPATTCP